MENNKLQSNIQASDVFHFDGGREGFDALSGQNGFTYWYARDLMSLLGYQSWGSFHKAVQKAISACTSLNINIFDNFVQLNRDVGGKSCSDYKLSRFACYLVAMNGDSKKKEVAMAQAYFAAIAEAFTKYVEEADEVERILVRDEISDHEKTLGAVAKKAGVHQYALFQNAGYRGLYNMNISALKERKNIPKGRTPLDFMGKEELAANLFRVTQTEAKMRNNEVRGQSQSERAAYEVGQKVRSAMHEISGSTPENLPPSEDIRKVKSAIKSSQKSFAKIDKSKK